MAIADENRPFVASLAELVDTQKRIVQTIGNVQTAVLETRQAIERVGRPCRLPSRWRNDLPRSRRGSMSSTTLSTLSEEKSDPLEIVAQNLQTLNAVQ